MNIILYVCACMIVGGILSLVFGKTVTLIMLGVAAFIAIIKILDMLFSKKD